jgi:hypothetical protein
MDFSFGVVDQVQGRMMSGCMNAIDSPEASDGFLYEQVKSGETSPLCALQKNRFIDPDQTNSCAHNYY